MYKPVWFVVGVDEGKPVSPGGVAKWFTTATSHSDAADSP